MTPADLSPTGIVLAVLALLLGSGAVANWVGKKATVRRSPEEKHDSRVTELERARVSDREEMAALKLEYGNFKEATNANMRILTDYVHDLREHIAEGKPPPPPDWPEGLRL